MSEHLCFCFCIIIITLGLENAHRDKNDKNKNKKKSHHSAHYVTRAENGSLLCKEQTAENKPGLFLIQIAELNKLVCRGVSPITPRWWGGEVAESVPHTNPWTPNQSFLTRYQDLFLSAAPASCKLYPPHIAPPWKWIWGKFKGTVYILFLPWLQFVLIFLRGADARHGWGFGVLR